MFGDVELTQVELHMGFQAAVLRKSASRNQKISGESKGGGDAWSNEINGALAEQAYCKWRNLYWSGSVGSFKNADVGTVTQIRHTSRANGCLIVRPDDDDDHYFVLVVGHATKMRMCGYMQGREAKAMTNYRRENPTAFFIPQSELKSFQKEKSND